MRVVVPHELVAAVAADVVEGTDGAVAVSYDATKLNDTHVVWIQASRQTDLVYPINANTAYSSNEPYYFICRADHPYAQRRSIALKELKGSSYIHTLRSGSLWRWIEPHMRGIELNDTGFEVQQLATLAGLIANGIGVSVVPGFALFQFHRLGLSAIRVRDRSLLRPLSMIKRRGHTLSVASRSLLEAIAAHPPEHVLPAPPADPAPRAARRSKGRSAASQR